MRPTDPNSASPLAAPSRVRTAAAALAPALFVLLALLLVGCGAPTADGALGAAASDDLRYLASLERVDGSGMLWDPAFGNCTVNEFGTPSQGFHMAGSGFHMAGSGFHMAGSVGGLMAQPPSAVIAPSDVPTALANDGGDVDAAVLVVDDFAGAGYAIDPALWSLRTADLATMQQLVAQGGFSHGSLVMHHVNATLAATGLYALDAVDPEQVVWRHVATDALLIVRMADTQGFDTSVIPNAIDGGLRALRRQGVERVAINMSFALVPCSVVDDFVDNLARFATFESYVSAVTGGSGAAVAALIGGIRDATESDPLRSYFQHPDFLSGEEQVRILVAASGNFSRDYAMYPAAWPEVLGVGASDTADLRRRAFFANAGEVLETGAWFQLEGLGLWAKPGARSRLAYAGTSFSAPAVAAISAVDLAAGDPRCALLRSDATLLATGADRDVPLAEAIPAFCR